MQRIVKLLVSLIFPGKIPFSQLAQHMNQSLVDPLVVSFIWDIVDKTLSLYCYVKACWLHITLQKFRGNRVHWSVMILRKVSLLENFFACFLSLFYTYLVPGQHTLHAYLYLKVPSLAYCCFCSYLKNWTILIAKSILTCFYYILSYNHSFHSVHIAFTSQMFCLDFVDKPQHKYTRQNLSGCPVVTLSTFEHLFQYLKRLTLQILIYASLNVLEALY